MPSPRSQNEISVGKRDSPKTDKFQLRSDVNQDCLEIADLNGPETGKEFNISNLSHFKNKRILTIGRYKESDPLMNDISLFEGSTNYLSQHHGTLESIIKDGIPVWFIRDGQW
jgi:hypothetical protein